MFQEFPYTNFHELNLDWIVKIAKDFLDQYTHIQEVIQTGLDDLAESRETGLAELDQKRLDSLAELNQKTLDGLADLQEKYDTLDGLLQAWYDTHSADIAGQLADAISDFNAAAEAKSQALLDSWPADYSELVTEYNNLKSELNYNIRYNNLFDKNNVEYGKYFQGGASTPTTVDDDTFCCLLVEIPGSYVGKYIMNYKDLRVDAYDENKNYLGQEYFNANTARNLTNANAKYLTISVSTAHLDDYMLLIGETIPATYVPYGVTLHNSTYQTKEDVNTAKQQAIDNSKNFTYEYIESNNIFDKQFAIQGKYYSGNASTPTLTDNSNYCCYLAEILDDQALYTVNYRDYQTDAYDSSKNRIETVHFIAGTPHTVPTGTRYLTISTTKEHMNDFMLVRGSLPINYLPFGTTLHDFKLPEYHVGTGQPYTQLMPLLKALENNVEEKIIYVHEGVYDIFSEYGGTTFIETLTGNEQWRDVSIFVPPNTKLIGIGNVVLSFEPTAEQIGSSANAGLFSVLNITYDCYIENLTLKAKNCRYCIHDETSGQTFPGAHHIYKNIICEKIQDTYNSYQQCFGGGFQEPLIFDFDGCIFNSWSIPFSIHNGSVSNNKKGALINIRNCYMQATISSVSISLRNNTTEQLHDICNIYNCFIGGTYGGLEVRGSNESCPNSFDVTMIGCNAILGQVLTTPENIYPIKQINSIQSSN